MRFNYEVFRITPETAKSRVLSGWEQQAPFLVQSNNRKDLYYKSSRKRGSS